MHIGPIEQWILVISVGALVIWTARRLYQRWVDAGWASSWKKIHDSVMTPSWHDHCDPAVCSLRREFDREQEALSQSRSILDEPEPWE